MEPPAENKESKYASLRVPKELSAKMAVIAEQLPGMSMNSLGVAFVEAIMNMIETPESQRITPAIVMMVDSVRKPGPVLLPVERPAETKPELRSTRLLRKAKETIK